MRIIDLWDLRNDKSKRDKLAKSIMDDIEEIAEEKMGDGLAFKKFKVEFRLVRISKYN